MKMMQVGEAVKIIGCNVLAKDLEEVSVYVFNIV